MLILHYIIQAQFCLKMMRSTVGDNLGRSPIYFAALMIVLLVCSLNESLLSNWTSRCFSACISFIVALLKWRGGYVILLVFLENISSCFFLARFGLNGIFHWFVQSCIFNALTNNAPHHLETSLLICNVQINWLFLDDREHWWLMGY